MRLLASLALLCLFAGTQLSPAVAKPPDLPLNQTTTCAPSAADAAPATGVPTGQSGGPLMLNGAAPGEVLDASRTETICALINWICPGASVPFRMLHLFGPRDANGLRAILGPQFDSSQPSPQTKAAPPQTGPGSTCPYLEAETEETPPSPDPAQFHGDVLANLEKLKIAEHLYSQAEQRRREGKLTDARRDYEQVRKLCPGSRYDAMAANKLQHLNDKTRPGEEAAASVATSKSAETAVERGCLGPPERIAELIEQAQRDYADGRYYDAEMSAETARRLDPECPAASMLLEKCREVIANEKKACAKKVDHRGRFQAQVVVRRKVTEPTATTGELEEEETQSGDDEAPCFSIMEPNHKLVAESMERSGQRSWCGNQLRRLGSLMDRVTQPAARRTSK